MKKYLGFPLYLRLLAIAGLLLMVSCRNSGKGEPAGESNLKETLPSEKQVDEPVAPGKLLYNQACLVCHQADGSGVPGMFPPVARSEFISGDPEKLVRLVVEGLTGPVEVQGEEYNGIMPPRDDLTDQQISDLLTWLRTNFGNSAGPVSPEQVAGYRK